MSFVRFGWGPKNEFPGTPEAERAGASDLYIIGTLDNNERVIECCGCLLARRENGLYLDPFPHLRTVEEVREHLDAHRNAGHVVHDYVQPNIEADFEPGGWMTESMKHG